jgi:hypothetical protein
MLRRLNAGRSALINSRVSARVAGHIILDFPGPRSNKKNVPRYSGGLFTSCRVKSNSKEFDMRSKPTIVMFSAVMAVAALYQASKVHATSMHAHEHGCSVASLKGTYAWHRTGVNNVVGGPIAEIGLATYDGEGTRGLIRNTRSTNGDIRPWTNEVAPNGKYTVEADCTGSFYDTDGTLSNDIVVLDGGKRYFVLSEATGTVVTEEGYRLDADE